MVGRLDLICIWSRSGVYMMVLIWYCTLFGLDLNRDGLDWFSTPLVPQSIWFSV